MPDYGHPLRFGSFITPVNSPAAKPVELAVLSEEVGFDLVTFQDHPYQSSFHDTWTLLTWVAARTERIELAGNVLNLPLRQPAVLARATASLDLLSGGRVNLGLGAGGFWDAIEAMGGGRLTPGQSVQALEEAIEVIRGIWDAGERRPLRVPGEFHAVSGAKRGPAPAHRVPIWLGAYGPRMLRLIGTSADGWLPSLPYLKAGDLSRGNETIDTAAQKAGRDPAEVVRLLNVSADMSAEEMADLALTEGISTFIVMGDDPGGLRRFATDVIPVVRDRVERGRAATGTTVVTRLRGRQALAKRREGIDYDHLPDEVAELAIEPGDHGYARYTSGYLRGGAPGLVLRPQNVPQVSAAIEVARRHSELPLGIFSAGHGLSGRSLNDGGLVIDVGALNGIEVLDAETGRVRIGPGATWVEVARVLAPLGWAISSGDYGGVGVGGLATAGGVGWFARQHGLTIDHLTAVEVALADSTVVRADAHERPDLFWGMRGAGANFGIAVAFEFQAAPVGQVGFAQLAFDAGDTVGFLQRWGEAIETSHRSVTGQVILGPPRGGSQVAQAMVLVNADDPEVVIERLQPVLATAPLLQHSVAMAGYDQVMAAFVSDAPQQGYGEPLSRSGLIEHLDADFADQVAAMLRAGASYFFQLRAVGGAVADVPPEDTAYAGRAANFAAAAFGSRGSGLQDWWERLLPFFDGLYTSFETGIGEDVLARAYPPAHLARLRELKGRYDPAGVFKDNFFIAPPAVGGSALEAS